MSDIDFTNASFDFLGDNTNTDFLQNAPVRPPLKPQNACEIAKATALVNNEGEEDKSDISTNLQITGEDPRVRAAMQSSATDNKDKRTQKLLERPANDIIKGLSSTLKSKVSPETDLVVNAATKLSKPEDVMRADFDEVLSWVDNNRKLDSMISARSEEIDKNTNWAKSAGDFLETVVPGYGAIADHVHRYQQSGKPSDLILRGTSADELADHIMSLPQAKQEAALSKLLDTVEASETLAGNKNSMYNQDLLNSIRMRLKEGPHRHDVWWKVPASDIYDDTMDVFNFLDVKGATDIVRHLVKKAFLTKGTEEAISHATGRGSLLDATNKISPDGAQEALATDNVIKAAEDLGNTPEEVIDRVMPTPEGLNNPVAMKSDFLKYDPTTLLSEQAEKEMASKRARNIIKASGANLEVRPELSKTFYSVNNPTDLPGYKGTVRFRFGSKGEEALTYEEAKSAANRLVGERTQLVTKNADGVFVNAKAGDKNVYLQVDQHIVYDPKMDAGVNELAFGTVGGVRDNPYILNPYRRFKEEIMKSYFGNKSVIRGVQAKVSRQAKTVQSLRGEDVEVFNSLVEKGNSEGKVYRSYKEAREASDNRINPTSYKAYQEYRDVQDTLHRIDNSDARRRLAQGNYKHMNVDGEDVFVRPEIDKPTYVEDPNKLGNGNVGGYAYDITSKEKVKLSPEVIDDIYGKGGLIAVRRGTTELDGGGFTQLIVRDKGAINPLPEVVLPYREGYFQRFYKDVSFMVSRPVNKVVNGFDIESREVLGLMPDLKSAKDMAAAIEGADVTFSRESNQTLRDLGGITEFGQLPTSQRKRGELIMGPEGKPAETLDPMEALVRQYSSIERKLGKDYVDLMKQRWINDYGQFLKGEHKGTFPLEFNNSVIDAQEAKKVENILGKRDVFKEAKSWYDHIRVAEGARDEPLFASFNREMENTISRLMLQDKTFKAGTLKVLDKALKKADLKQLATTWAIVGRPLFQIPTNMMQLLYIVARNPVDGMFSAAQTVPLGMALLTRSTSSWKGVSKGLAKAFRMSQPEFERFVDGFMESGLHNPQLSDDFLRYTKASYKGVSAESMKWGFLPSPFKISRELQGKSVMYSNMGGYIQAYKDFKNAKGHFPVTPRERSTVLANADLLLQSQNSVDRFKFQEGANPLSFALQFMQHVTKLFYDIVLDPAVKLTSGKSIGMNPSAFAETRGQAAKTLFGVLALFGTQGWLGQTEGTKVSDNIRILAEDHGINAPDEAWDMFNGGLVNLLINSFIDGSVNVTGRVTPAGVIDNWVDYMLDNPTQVDMLGASGSALAALTQTAATMKAFALNTNLPVKDRVQYVLATAPRMLLGVDDVYKAYAAYNTGRMLSGKDAEVAGVTKDEAILRAFSFHSWNEVYTLMERNEAFDRQERVKGFGDMGVKFINDSLVKAQDLTKEQQLEMINTKLIPAVADMCPKGLEDDVLRYVTSRMLHQRDLLGNRLEQTLKDSSLDETLHNLKLLRDRYDGDANVKSSIEFQIKTLQEMIDTNLENK